MRRLMATFMVALLVSLVMVVTGQGDEFEELRKRQQEEWEAAHQEGQVLFEESEQAWNQMLREQQEAWARMVAEIERIWRDSLTTTKKEWVDYSDDYGSRSYVNFETGEMVLATMIQTSESRLAKLSNERIARQLAKVLSAKNDAGRAILAGQIADSRGQPVNAQTVNRYLEQEVLPRVQRKPQSVMGKDGVPRYQFTVPIKLIPEHTMVRARPYIREVSQQAGRFRLQPELIMAVIHTESYFDPLARSHVPAYGLMQLVPKYGARESYQFIYGQDRLLPANYLYRPENNIELGSGYLHLLIYKHFVGEPNPVKRLYLSICGYNWGPTAIQRNILGRHPTASMSPEQLYQVLQWRAPEETRNYLQRVSQRLGMYRPLFEHG